MSMRAKLFRYLPMLFGVVLACLMVFGAIKLLSATDDGEAPARKAVQQVTLLTPPPPPPPPPKVEEPPEPEVQEEVELDDPIEDLPDVPDAPVGDQLGLDADGGAGDSFGLIGRKGGRGLLDIDPKAVYAGRLQGMIEDLLIDNEEVRKRAYSIVAQVWVDDSGKVVKTKLSKSTGDKNIDDRLLGLINGVEMIAEAPPENMPQPIRLRISSRI